MSRYDLKPETKEKYLPIIQQFIKELEEYPGSSYDKKMNLSDTELNPYTLSVILKDLGYEVLDLDRNGWEVDFWWYFRKPGCKSVQITGTAMIFEMFIQGWDE